MNINQQADMWLNNRLIPVTPHTRSVKNSNQNESLQSVDGTPITIPRKDKAQTFTLIFMFPFVLDDVIDEAWVNSQTGFKNIKELTDFLWQLKQDREPFVLTIVYPDESSFNGEFILDDYDYTQDATDGSDYQVTLSFTEYYPAQNNEVNGQIQNSLIEHGIRNPRRVD